MGKGDGLLRLEQRRLRGGFLKAASIGRVVCGRPSLSLGIGEGLQRMTSDAQVSAVHRIAATYQLRLYHQPQTQSSPLPVMNRVSVFPQSHMLKSEPPM